MRSPLCYFLCLPPAIRLRIYSEAGLLDGCYLDLNRQRNTNSRRNPHFAYGLDCSYNLLLTCRIIYSEVSSFLYSTNKFTIRFEDSKGLQALRSLTPASLWALNHLTVHLNLTACRLGLPCHELALEYGQTRQTREDVEALSPRSQEMFDEWQSTVAYIMAHVKPFNLRFYVICDVEDVESANQVRPFRGIQNLAGCAVRLGQQPITPIKNIAHQTASLATGRRTDHLEHPFRLMDLLPELRRQILTYTDLVTPLGEVEWNPKKGFHYSYETIPCPGYDHDWFPPEYHHACQFRTCLPHSFGCFCPRSHAASLSTCKCWRPPTALFLVCRALTEDAREIFFMKNKFIITPSTRYYFQADQTPTRLEVSRFLTEIVPMDKLQFLRSLDIIFPPFEEDYLRPHEPAFQDWLQTITYIEKHLCLGVLTMRIYMPDCEEHQYMESRKQITEEKASKIFEMYTRTLGPLSKLRGLHRFFAHLAWPWEWTEQARDRCRQDPDYRQLQVANEESRIERLIMGDDYDGMALGKAEERSPQWLDDSTKVLYYP